MKDSIGKLNIIKKSYLIKLLRILNQSQVTLKITKYVFIIYVSLFMALFINIK